MIILLQLLKLSRCARLAPGCCSSFAYLACMYWMPSWNRQNANLTPGSSLFFLRELGICQLGSLESKVHCLANTVRISMTTEEDSDVFAALRVLTFFVISPYLESFRYLQKFSWSTSGNKWITRCTQTRKADWIGGNFNFKCMSWTVTRSPLECHCSLGEIWMWTKRPSIKAAETSVKNLQVSKYALKS